MRHHSPNHFFVVVDLLGAGARALKHPIIALLLKDAFRVKTRLFEERINIGGYDEVFLICNQFSQLLIQGKTASFVTVEKDVPSPVAPLLFKGCKGVETSRVHIGHAVLLDVRGEVVCKTLTAVDVACRC